MDGQVSYRDRITGGLLGLLIGDALGVPYEFHSPDEIPSLDKINYSPPIGFNRAHQEILPATWSDDGAQALCLLASLLHCGQLDLRDFANRLINWYEHGYMAVDNLVYDVGIATGQAICRLKQGVVPNLAGASDEFSNGNGALMRVLPLALWHKGTDEQLVRDAQQQSLVTHGHLRSQLCCALYCLVARYVLNDDDNSWQKAVDFLRVFYEDNEEALQELEFHICPDDDIPATGSGYVVDSLRAVKVVLAIPSYQKAVRYAISLGNDTDTTACIVGGIIGLRDSISSIPQNWIDELRGQELYQPLLEQLITTIK
ncbi:ADP-ribosylglycohydrolase family protein [Entomomonas asaccharolytica]|uniref:ADP-ribosylglycohydrolase family protein n=1 Tax=Entomomonas asaccharolytica TaxID=2785331 RepID=A0A974NFF1_9GAMM|nr:ADP-ribosylglycohydrolase family protein [Entomomonas asaccharolytica]QQP85568.1 ADP-ribosylglycohydrolase family protein [Entomomonas asaccharolytica]